MAEDDLVLLLTKILTVTHLSLSTFDTEIALITNDFLYELAETRHRKADILLPYFKS